MTAGVVRVGIVDPIAKTITVFEPDTLPVTYRGNRAVKDTHFPGVSLTPQQLFPQAGLWPHIECFEPGKIILA